MTDFDIQEMEAYTRRMMAFAERSMPRETKKFIRAEGSKLKKATLAEAKSKVRTDHKKPEKFKNSIHYHKSIKRGKVYKFNGALSIRTYSYAPHTHLIEDGHVIISHKKEVGFQAGKHVFETAWRKFSEKYVEDCKHFVDEVTHKL